MNQQNNNRIKIFRGFFFCRREVLFVSFLFFFSFSFSRTYEDSCRQQITLSFAGDMMCHMPQIHAAYVEEADSFDFSPSFAFLKPYFSHTDIAVVNLETTFGGKPYSGYPQFSAPAALARAAKDAGLHYFVMANNHCYDRGAPGFEKTLQTLDSLQIIHTGVFRNRRERDTTYPLIIRKKGFTIALLNYTYGTNGIAVTPPHIVNNIDTARIAADIDSCLRFSPDIVIACMHWGTEYERKPNARQEQLAQWLIKKGCHAVIGSHPHVVQPVRVYFPESKDSSCMNVVYFSLGNFLSNQRDRYRDGGIIAELTFEKNEKTRLIKFNYLPFWVYKGTLHGRYHYYAIPVMLFLKQPGMFPLPETEKAKMLEFYNDTRQWLHHIPENDFFALPDQQQNTTP